MTDYPPLPAYVPEQIALYQTDHLLRHEACRFDPVRAAALLPDAPEVLAIDLGGDKVRGAIVTLRGGSFRLRDEQALQAKGGAGYLAFLEERAAEATRRGLAIGVSTATKLDGSRIARTTNLPIFHEEFRARYDADYANLFPDRSFIANDTVAGIAGASARLALAGDPARSVAFFICASGVGASVIANGVAIHVEAAHVPLADALNPLGQTTRCNLPENDYVCLERVTAARAGIEDLYRQQTGESLDGIALGRRYQSGEPLPTVLYETSALALAHAMAGVMARYDFADDDTSVVIGHGGNFEIARYRAAVARNLQRLPHCRARLVFSRDLSPNACLDGAAVLAASSAGTR